MRQLHFSEIGWDYVSTRHMAAVSVFMAYALPLSFIPPLMLYYAGTHFSIEYLSLLKGEPLQQVCVIFFLAEQAMLLLMAAAIQRLGETLLGAVEDRQLGYDDCFKLSAIAATPLWLVPLILFAHSITAALVVAPVALIAAALLIFQGVPAIFKIAEKERAALFSTAIVFAGIVGWATMFYIVALTLSIATPM